MTKRSTTTRDRHRALIRRDEPPCHLCGGPINYDLPHLDPGAFVVDHVIPLARGGEDALHNKKAAHRQPSLQRDQGQEGRRRDSSDQPSRPRRQLAPMVTDPGTRPAAVSAPPPLARRDSRTEPEPSAPRRHP